MSRLFTFGCSFTHYFWPTWADFLRFNYDEYQNWGGRGFGNQAIFELLIEANTRNKFTKGDTIIIMWSSHQRHDLYKIGWNGKGNILTAGEGEKHDEYIKENFEVLGSVYHTLNYISAARLILESLDIKWYMTAMDDLMIPLIEWDGVETHLPGVSNRPIFEQWPQMSIYEHIFDGDNWLEYYDDKHEVNALVNICLKPRGTDTDADSFLDPHPSPDAHYNWLKHVSSTQAPGLKIGREAQQLLNMWKEWKENSGEVVYVDEATIWMEEHCRVQQCTF